MIPYPPRRAPERREDTNEPPDDPEAIARTERLAAALRANLKRRKAQSRGRQTLAETEDKSESSKAAAGGPVDKVGRGED